MTSNGETGTQPMYESAFAVAMNDHPFSLASARQMSDDTVIANTVVTP